MSEHSEPYANGFGILAGVLILWVGTLAICLVAKALFYADPAAAGEGEEDLDSRGRAQSVDVASMRTMEAYRSLASRDAISQADLFGLELV